MANQVFIYALDDPDTYRPRYIGQTIDPDVRVVGHLTCTPDDTSPKGVWINGLKAAGKAPSLRILQVVDPADALSKEQWWITYFRSEGEDLFNAPLGRPRSGQEVRPNGRMSTSHRLHVDTLALIDELAGVLHITQANVIELGVRALAKQELPDEVARLRARLAALEGRNA